MSLVGVVMLLGLVACGSGSSSSSGTTSGVASPLNPSVSQPTKYPVSSVEYLDSNADGTIDTSRHRTHDSAGNILTSKEDYSNDGSFDTSYEETYDSSGNLTKFVEDSDNNGSADLTCEYAYDEHNTQTSRVCISESERSTETYTNTYDEEGRIIKQVVDNDGITTEYTMQYGYREGYGYYQVESEWEHGQDYTNWSVGYWLSEDLSNRKTYTRCYFDLFGDLNVTCAKSEKTNYGDRDRATSLETSPVTGIFVENIPPAVEALLSLTESLINEMGSSSEVETTEYTTEYDDFGNLIAFAMFGPEGEFEYIKVFVNSYADGTTTSYADADVDGFPEGVDCNDNDTSMHLPAAETCDGIDNDCDGQVDEDGGETYYADVDGDGYGNEASSTTACSQPAGFVTNDGDCNDADAEQHSASTHYYPDVDGDGHGAEWYDGVLGCVTPTGYAESDDDCDDNDPTVYGGAEEFPSGLSDAKDNDCDGMVDETLYYSDTDRDGYGDDQYVRESEEELTYGSYVIQGGDCDDDDDTVHPGARDCLNPSLPIQGKAGVDDNCDEVVDDDVGCVHPAVLEPTFPVSKEPKF